MIISAPSGAGKTTIVKHLLGISELNLHFQFQLAPGRAVKVK